MPAQRHSSSASRFSPYPTSIPFASRSASQKSRAVSSLHNLACSLSGNSPDQLYEYLIQNSRIGAQFSLNSINSSLSNSILQRIKLLHENSSLKFKSTILALIAGLFSRKTLLDSGFLFSSIQYRNALRKANSSNFMLSDYKRNVPPSRRPIEENTRELVIEYLKRYSRNSSEMATADGSCIYHLEKTKVC